MAEEKNSTSLVETINKEINVELSNESVSKALLATTFKGLTPVVMKQALMDGMIRGFTFLNFRQKDVYAVPYASSYSLVTSIDYSRKIGARSGIVGKNPPIYEMAEDGKTIISCTVTVKKRFPDGYIGDFTATVYFEEYTTKRNLWISKPRTMIAKVAEMHALRMACPEEMAQQYIEEEMEMEIEKKPTRISEVKAMVENNPLRMGNFKQDENTKDEETQEVPDTERSVQQGN